MEYPAVGLASGRVHVASRFPSDGASIWLDTPPMSGQVVHKLIASTAKAIAGEVYEVLASQHDRFYRRWPKQNIFIRRNWHEFIGHARNSLAVMLRPIPGTEKDPRYHYSQHVRDEVMEALLLDGAFKAPPPLDVHTLRAQAGFDSLAEVMKSRTGQVMH